MWGGFVRGFVLIIIMVLVLPLLKLEGRRRGGGSEGDGGGAGEGGEVSGHMIGDPVGGFAGVRHFLGRRFSGTFLRVGRVLGG